jgi:tRNA(fMet)-specific endonuclease VapC
LSVRVLIDTNAFAALLSGDERVALELDRAEAVLLSPIVVGELLDGFLGGSRPSENRATLERFRSRPRTLVVPVTDATAEWFAQIKRALRRKGRPVPIADAWIAASCMEHGARLLTFDRNFADIDGLLRWEP